MIKVLTVAVLSLGLVGCGGVNKYFKGSLLAIEMNQSDDFQSEAVQACKIKSRSVSELQVCLNLRGN